MTKTKKIAAIAVSVVLAGTMAVGLVGCGKKNDKTVDSIAVNMKYASGTEINVGIGYSNAQTGMFYSNEPGTGVIIAGKYRAETYGAKPATQAIMDALDVKLVDKYSSGSTSVNLTNYVNDNTWGNGVDMATSDLSVAATEASKGTVLNLADYLQYMPNFKAFLEKNPIVYLSVLGGDMDTSTGEGQELYVAPYFDGMDDIEKGVLMRQDWIEDLLDKNWDNANEYASNNDTFKSACFAVTTNTSANMEKEATQTHAASYMGETGSWSIASTAEDGESIITVKKDYDAAKAAAANSSTGLGVAYYTIANEYYSGESGNIVDIMNAALLKNLEASGEQLANLYKGYIAAAYSVDGAQYYGTSNVAYSKVFNGYSACWDVDDLVALLRIVKCSSGQVGLTNEKTTGIFPRDWSNDRLPDIISLVGELYGVRGATSRYESTYIDSTGTLQDARNDVEFWEALEAFGGLALEGLVEDGYYRDGTGGKTAVKNVTGSYLDELHGSTQYKGSGFMQWDYSQTQTTQLFNGTGDTDANYGWVNTPVSTWNDGTKSESGYSYNKNGEKYMRFTDSWRSTKTAGLVVAASVADDPNKLAACLSFVDYLYSNDGQITTTYGIQDTTGNSSTPNGTWYGTEIKASDVDSSANDYKDLCDENYQWVIKDEYDGKYVVNGGYVCDMDGNVTKHSLEDYADRVSFYSVKEEYQSQCFTYGGKLYAGTLYKGKMTPTITTELFNNFIDENSPEVQTFGSNVKGSFTNYARMVLGSTLPICVKDQSFENQMTAEIAKNDATRVSVSISNGTINHCQLTITENQFYTCVPTGFPLSNLDQAVLDDPSQDTLRYTTGAAYSGKTFCSIYHWIIWYGYNGVYTDNGCNVNFDTLKISDAEGMIGYLNGLGLDYRLEVLQDGWETAKNYWNYLSK